MKTKALFVAAALSAVGCGGVVAEQEQTGSVQEELSAGDITPNGGPGGRWWTRSAFPAPVLELEYNTAYFTEPTEGFEDADGQGGAWSYRIRLQRKYPFVVGVEGDKGVQVDEYRHRYPLYARDRNGTGSVYPAGYVTLADLATAPFPDGKWYPIGGLFVDSAGFGLTLAIH